MTLSTSHHLNLSLIRGRKCFLCKFLIGRVKVIFIYHVYFSEALRPPREGQLRNREGDQEVRDQINTELKPDLNADLKTEFEKDTEMETEH